MHRSSQIVYIISSCHLVNHSLTIHLSQWQTRDVAPAHFTKRAPASLEPAAISYMLVLPGSEQRPRRLSTQPQIHHPKDKHHLRSRSLLLGCVGTSGIRETATMGSIVATSTKSPPNLPPRLLQQRILQEALKPHPMTLRWTESPRSLSRLSKFITR